MKFSLIYKKLEMKIKVLLLKDVAWIGWKWQLVDVSDAMFRNVLSKKWEAKMADKKTIKAWEKKQEKQRQENIEIDKRKHEAVNTIKGSWLEIKVQTSPDGHLYEKIDIRHIQSQMVSTHKVKFENREIDFPEKKVSKVWNYEFFVKIDWKKVSLELKVLTK